ncbi:hypothetical protein ACFO25_08015 [Paenactinomyces guangxiensis]|uniref:Uncharacterized protein n=1 Tax=Paenactinomyces guangxiensis TaxID=1490290 RepID=A0A7W2A6Y6_9BACL|nr:hypothetical protein [Paenactinomyces guangxiensis]MBA4493010.1 hypothetical protein [Paenactinomyces guangxiensis]MBH8590141.1 hypothetical protein [Paenactinomyces guangxiensis]
MLKLKVEGPEGEVQAFMNDFTNNPQCSIKSCSQPFQNDYLENDETNSFCYFDYHPLHEIGKAMVVTFQTQNGEDLTFSLEYGKVIRVGNIVHITGKISSFLPQIAGW